MTVGLYEMTLGGDGQQWFLRGPLDRSGQEPKWPTWLRKDELDPRIFTSGKRVDVDGARLVMKVGAPGHPVDISFGPFLIPVVTEAVASVIDAIAPSDIQRLPVEVESSTGSYEILNVITRINCIDEERTVGEKWTEADHRSDLAGQWRDIYDLKLRSETIGKGRIFRIEGWTNSLIVTDDIRTALGDVTGAVFVPIS